jgi:hypothetical protein
MTPQSRYKYLLKLIHAKSDPNGHMIKKLHQLIKTTNVNKLLYL